MSIYITRHMLNPDLYPLKMEKRSGFLRRGWQFLVRKWGCHQAILALEAMDDRLLRDIGLYRADITRAVNGSVDHQVRMMPLAPLNTVSRIKTEDFRKAA
ncbi:DUF1127 domain-containing protein [Hoeflea sp. G2-23]|uniref:DUF1127 domain-containing protein n=1 Tax=Hoeflea algicola TaxID=2983763 RepID=A0ABT3ZEN9_9HYPH|nr:DUF1127 domain-containing protein [Hoeflea algicola]MCY0150121.1 DUF1127 domain-containing protein [Hoeflea algicola]